MFIISNQPTNPQHASCHRLFLQDPATLPVYCRNSIAHGYGPDGLATLQAIRAAKQDFDTMPLVGDVCLHPVGNTETVRRMPGGSFAYFKIYGGHFWQFMSVSAGEVLHHLIQSAEWPREKSDFAGIAGFQQVSDGTFQGGSWNDPRAYTFDYRIAPDGRKFNLHTCNTYRDVYRLSDGEASEAVKKYFGI